MNLNAFLPKKHQQPAEGALTDFAQGLLKERERVLEDWKLFSEENPAAAAQQDKGVLENISALEQLKIRTETEPRARIRFNQEVSTFAIVEELAGNLQVRFYAHIPPNFSNAITTLLKRLCVETVSESQGEKIFYYHLANGQQLVFVAEPFIRPTGI